MPSPHPAQPEDESLKIVGAISTGSKADADCLYKETFDFQRSYGLVRWIYYVLQNGQYVQQNQTVYNHLASGGAPAPDHPCW
jgi:hypothetical protein